MGLLLVLLACFSSVFASVETSDLVTNTRFHDLEEIVSKLEQRLGVLEKENELLRDLNKVNESHFDKVIRKQLRRQLLTSTVAFTAVVTQGTVNNLQRGDVVIFDRVITNVAAAYDSNNGIFTAPVAGVYVFNFALMVEPGTREYLQIVKDGQYILNNYAHATTVSVFASSSRTVTLELQQGSKVWIQTPPDFDHGDGAIHGNHYTTFSGWLLSITE